LIREEEPKLERFVIGRVLNRKENIMTRFGMICSASIIAMLGATGAMAQNEGARGGAVSGAATGAVGGAIVGGPVGAVVGGAAGAVGGAVVGGIADDSRPKFRTYVQERHVPSYTYDREVTVGATLPSSGVAYYDVPAEYGAKDYRYTVVNKRTVLVDPSSHRVVQVIE
jgi:uncharacterized protein YcfJ